MCSAVADFFVHMGSRERLVGGVDRAAALVAHAYELTDAVVEAMGDPSNFGMAKSLFATELPAGRVNPLADLGAMIEAGVDGNSPEFQAMLQERMDAFNAMPMEDRKAITDRSLAPRVPTTQRIRIPVVDIPPLLEDVERSAADSRLLQMIDRLARRLRRTEGNCGHLSGQPSSRRSEGTRRAARHRRRVRADTAVEGRRAPNGT